MFKFLLIVAAGLAVLTFSEIIRRNLGLANESSRKTYHVVHALLIGVAPFFVSYNVIILLELLLLVEMLVVRKFKLFPWLYEVGRISWGDLFAIVGIVLIALMHPNKWVFLAALLHLGIADAMAALIGKRYGKHREYKAFGQTKSVPGSLAFYITSLIITAILVVGLHPSAGGLVLLLTLPPLVTLAEMASPFGADNFVIPILVVLVLNGLRFTP